MVKKKVKKVPKKKSHETKILLGMGILLGMFFIFGFSLHSQNITGYTITKDVKDVGSFFVSILKPIAEKLLGDVGEPEMLFAKVLFLIIVFGILYLSLSTVKFFNVNKGWMYLIISAASIAMVRWLGDISVIKSILLPYSAAGIALLAGLPFVIYFLVINKGLADQPGIIRRIAWIFFAIAFMGLHFTRSDELAGNAIIYPLTALVAVIMALIDGTIQKIFIKIRGGYAQIEINKNAIDDLLDELGSITKSYQAGVMPFERYKEKNKEIKEKISVLSET